MSDNSCERFLHQFTQSKPALVTSAINGIKRAERQHIVKAFLAEAERHGDGDYSDWCKWAADFINALDRENDDG